MSGSGTTKAGLAISSRDAVVSKILRGLCTRSSMLAKNRSAATRRRMTRNPREVYLDLEESHTLLMAMPEHLRLTVRYLYFTASRVGEVQQITWGMVSKDCKEISIPARITKTDKARTVPLVGPLAEICEAL